MSIAKMRAEKMLKLSRFALRFAPFQPAVSEPENRIDGDHGQIEAIKIYDIVEAIEELVCNTRHISYQHYEKKSDTLSAGSPAPI